MSEENTGTTKPTMPTEMASAEPMLQFFEYAHLPKHLQDVSGFCRCS